MTEKNTEWYAKLASLSYMKNFDRKNLLKSTFRNLQVVKEDSNDGNTVLINPVSGQVYVSMRGTDFSTLKSTLEDLSSDAGILAGTLTSTSRFKEDRALVRRLAEKYGASNITLSGTSLGGRLASEVAQDVQGVHVHSFNEGSSVVDIYHALNPSKESQAVLDKREKQKNNIHKYFVSGDVISASSNITSVLNHDQNINIIQKKEGLSPHDLQNWVGTSDYEIQ
jgi:hypothetical protein